MKLKQVIKRAANYILHGVPVNNISANIVRLNRSNLLEGRTAIITGGTSGIGYEIAKSFLMAGANVIITGRNNSRVQMACDKLQAETNRPSIRGIELNNIEVDCFADKINTAVSFWGKIDILVNNAGVLTQNTVGNENSTKYDEVLDTNLKGPFFHFYIFWCFLIKCLL